MDSIDKTIEYIPSIILYGCQRERDYYRNEGETAKQSRASVVFWFIHSSSKLLSPDSFTSIGGMPQYFLAIRIVC